MKKEIITVIEKDTTINSEINQLKDSECDCEKENTTDWDFPIICKILLGVLFGIGCISVFFLSLIGITNNQRLQNLFIEISIFFFLIAYNFFFIHEIFNCSW